MKPFKTNSHDMIKCGVPRITFVWVSFFKIRVRWVLNCGISIGAIHRGVSSASLRFHDEGLRIDVASQMRALC
jgi:hypothetical protein